MSTITVVGAEITQPPDEAERAEYLSRVLALPGVDGLEIPVASELFRGDRDFLYAHLPEGGAHVLNLVGATMERSAQGVGFAALDQAGRDAAFRLADEASLVVDELGARGSRVAAIVVQSAPTVDPDEAGRAADALAESLRALVARDWGGAAILLEHCDARRPGEPFTKGFLSLALELDVLHALRADGLSVGVLINWGRSAIDGRSAETPLAHVAAARDAGLLGGAVVSGVVPESGAYGEAWADTHAPARPREGSAGEPTSLLTAERASVFLAAADVPELVVRGVKLSLRDPAASIADRIAVNEALLPSSAR